MEPDFSPGMLALGKKKIMKKREYSYSNTQSDNDFNRDDNIYLSAGNALCLPFKDKVFDALFIAFGIRNIIDRQSAVKEFHRTLKGGGTLAILELTSPAEGLFRDIYLLYFKRLRLQLVLYSQKIEMLITICLNLS